MEILKVRERTVYDSLGEFKVYDIMRWYQFLCSDKHWHWMGTTTDEAAAHKYKDYIQKRLGPDGKFLSEDKEWEVVNKRRKLPESKRYKKYKEYRLV